MRKSFIALLFVAAFVGGVHAQTTSGGNDEPREFAAFFDAYLAERMEADHVAGAAVSVVKDGRVVLAKGYGWADVEKRIPVDPGKTIFVLGSLSKLFTWTAAMQLVERGLLDPKADVNEYLDFAIPATYPQPITLESLMAHASGFEDVKYGQLAVDAVSVVPLGDWLKAHVPSRIRPPFTYSAYGNYGAALAGYLVERVSGMKFDDYIDSRILSPLGMERTTARQPAPEALAGDLSKCYLFDGGVYRSQDRMAALAANVAPAASIKADAEDMARFMIALLDGGRDGGSEILKEETKRLLRRRSFSHERQVNGMAHGFWEMDMNGRRIIGHAGSHPVFNSILLLFPDEGLGVFVVTNSRGGSSFVGENFPVFERDFVNHFFPVEKSPPVPPVNFASRAARYGGTYRMTYGRAETTPEKFASLPMSIAVSASRTGLRVALPGGSADFIEAEPLVFKRTDGDERIVFREDGKGEISEAFYSAIPLTALIKNRWFETPAFNLAVVALCLGIFLSFLVRSLAAVFFRREGSAPTGLELAARLLAVIASLSGPILLFCALASLFNMYALYVGDLPLWPLVRLFSLVSAASAAGSFVFVFPVWRRRFWTVSGRIHYTLVALASVGFALFFWFWNLLGRGL